MAEVRILEGDCRVLMAAMPEASVSAIVCDPPYGIQFMGREWDSPGRMPGAFTLFHQSPEQRSTRSEGVRQMLGRMVEYQAWSETWVREAFRVLKPGGHLLAFGGTRTFHRLTCAIEDAGFEIRDCLSWLYGSGFPKSLDVSKALDSQAGARREVLGTEADRWTQKGNVLNFATDRAQSEVPILGEAVTSEAQQWQGWGTALKPGHEPVILASKPLTVAQHLAIVLAATTNLMEEACRWSGWSASDVEQSFSAIRARSLAEDASVLDPVRMRSLASIGLAWYAAPGSTSLVLDFSAATRTKVATALSHVRPPSSEAGTPGQTIPPGQADALLSQLMATCTSVMRDGIAPSIVSSWSSISGDLSQLASTCTIETATRLTTALKILNSLMLPLTSGDIGASVQAARFRPAWEPIILARKPLDQPNVAQNVLKHGTGALNIDATRLHTPGSEAREYTVKRRKPGATNAKTQDHNWRPQTDEALPWEVGREFTGQTQAGRWPANVVLSHTPECREVGTRQVKRDLREVHPLRPDVVYQPNSLAGRVDGSLQSSRALPSTTEEIAIWDCAEGCPVRLLDEQSGERGGGYGVRGSDAGNTMYGGGHGLARPDTGQIVGFGDSGGASRFFGTFPAANGREGEASAERRYTEAGGTNFAALPGPRGGDAAGRWPANVVLAHTPDCKEIGTRRVERRHIESHSDASNGIYGNGLNGSRSLPSTPEDIPVWDCAEECPVRQLDEQSGVSTSSTDPERFKGPKFSGRTYAGDAYSLGMPGAAAAVYGDTGGASRFFYTAKASGSERNERLTQVGARNTHPTVKPVDLMRWLIRLVTPPGGTLLDPFCGSGSTLVAALQEGVSDIIGMDIDPSYCELARQRIDGIQMGFAPGLFSAGVVPAPSEPDEPDAGVEATQRSPEPSEPMEVYLPGFEAADVWDAPGASLEASQQDFLKPDEPGADPDNPF
jgi:DNA modification methylase